MYNYEFGNNYEIIMLYNYEGKRYLKYKDKIYSNVQAYNYYNNKLHVAIYVQNKITHKIIE